MLILIIRKCWISHPLIDWTSNQSTYSVHTCTIELWLWGSTTVLFAHAPKRSRETTLYHWSHWCTWHWAFFTTPHIIRDIINHEELRHHYDKKRHFGFIVGNINFFNYILLFYLSCAFILKCVKWIYYFFFTSVISVPGTVLSNSQDVNTRRILPRYCDYDWDRRAYFLLPLDCKVTAVRLVFFWVAQKPFRAHFA